MCCKLQRWQPTSKTSDSVRCASGSEVQAAFFWRDQWTRGSPTFGCCLRALRWRRWTSSVCFSVVAAPFLRDLAATSWADADFYRQTFCRSVCSWSYRLAGLCAGQGADRLSVSSFRRFNLRPKHQRNCSLSSKIIKLFPCLIFRHASNGLMSCDASRNSVTSAPNWSICFGFHYLSFYAFWGWPNCQ